jgi:hypothetical protein
MFPAMRIRFCPRIVFVVTLVAMAATAFAGEPINTGFWSKLTLKGYDPVAYFTAHQPVEGSKDFTTDWNGATWRFVSAQDRDLFIKDPAKYAPQFGGYCAWAMTRGAEADIDPTCWKIVQGKLYLNYSKDIQQQWQQDIPGNIAKADAAWKALVEKSKE